MTDEASSCSSTRLRAGDRASGAHGLRDARGSAVLSGSSDGLVSSLRGSASPPLRRHRHLERFAAAYLAELRSAAQRGELVWPSRAQLLARTADLVAAVERDPIIRIPGELVMMSRVLATVAGLFQHYRPRLDFAARVLPHLVRAAAP